MAPKRAIILKVPGGTLGGYCLWNRKPTEMKKIVITLLLAILMQDGVVAQQVLSLEECINIALDNNLDIKRAKNNAVGAKATYTQSKFSFLPSLNAGASHSWSEGLAFDQRSGGLVNTTTLQGGGSIRGSLDIFNGFSNILGLKRDKYLYMAAEQSVESNIQGIEASIVASFLQVVSTKENLKIAQYTMGLLNEQLSREEKRERAGVGNMEQVYNFRSQVASQKLTIVNLQNNLESNKLTLLQLLRLNPADNYDFSGISAEDSELNAGIEEYEAVYEKSLQHSPAVLSAEYGLEASKKSLKIAQYAWMPYVGVTASYGTGWSSNLRENEQVVSLSTQFENNISKRADFSLNIPLFTRFQNRANVQRSKINVLNSELTLQQAKNDLTNQVQQAYLNLVNAKTSYNAAKESLLNLNTAFEFSKTRYENGTIDFVTYLQSLNGKNRGELELANAKYAILFRKYILDIYTGELNLSN